MTIPKYLELYRSMYGNTDVFIKNMADVLVEYYGYKQESEGRLVNYNKEDDIKATVEVFGKFVRRNEHVRTRESGLKLTLQSNKDMVYVCRNGEYLWNDKKRGFKRSFKFDPYAINGVDMVSCMEGFLLKCDISNFISFKQLESRVRSGDGITISSYLTSYRNIEVAEVDSFSVLSIDVIAKIVDIDKKKDTIRKFELYNIKRDRLKYPGTNKVGAGYIPCYDSTRRVIHSIMVAQTECGAAIIGGLVEYLYRLNKLQILR